MAWGIQYCDDAVAIDAPGIFIPRSEITGLIANNELASANKERKVAYGICNSVYEGVTALANKLGIAVTRPALVGSGDNKVNQTFTLTAQLMVNHTTAEISPIPLPAGNAGKVSIHNLFPTAADTSAYGGTGNTPGAGVIVPHALVQGYGSAVPANLATGDHRDWLIALYFSMLDQLEPSTALVSSTRGNAVGLTPPANFTGANAITGINAEDLPLRSFFSTTFNFGFQLALNQQNQDFDLAA